jgi:transcriptional regulator with XRE-family HTH domain
MPPKSPGKSKNLDQAFRAELKKLREDKKWTQYDLSDASGYRQSYLSNIETGRQTPSVTVLFDLLQTFGRRPDLYMRDVLKRVESKSTPKQIKA